MYSFLLEVVGRCWIDRRALEMSHRGLPKNKGCVSGSPCNFSLLQVRCGFCCANPLNSGEPAGAVPLALIPGSI